MTTDPLPPTWHLAALEQPGLELGAPHVLTRTKRRVETADVDAGSLPSDSLRFVGWAPQAIEARFPGLDPDAAFEVEATYLCERAVRRVVALRTGPRDLHPPTELARGGATVIRVPVPHDAVAEGALELRVERIEGPDVTLSELRLYASRPVAPILTVLGDAGGGLIGTVGAPDGTGVADARVRVGRRSGGADGARDAGATGRTAIEVRTDKAGVFRVRASELRGLVGDGVVTLTTGSGATAVETSIDLRHVAHGLRELPPASDRIDLAGSWAFHGGPYRDDAAATAPAETATVPGHVIYDGLVPIDGVATFLRTVELPADWAGRSVLLRCDGAYGRAEVRLNGSLVGGHGSGATSFEVDLTAAVRQGPNVLAITLTEFTPYAVLDDMPWYAHMSLLGIWRDVFLCALPPLHVAGLAIAADWDPEHRTGSLALDMEVVDGQGPHLPWQLEVTIRDVDGGIVHAATRSGSTDATGRTPLTIETGPLAVSPWSAELPRLYELELVVRGAAGETGAVARRRIGFRRVERRGNQLLVNGAPIRVRGVNRHDSRIDTGRALSAEDMWTDIRNLRETNVNVIRTSHYPPSPHLLEACDELGMFVFEQPPICFSGGFDDHHWTRTNEAAPLIPYLLEVTSETVTRDRGHPSVIVWDLGNESRWGPAFDAQLALVRELDPSRPTIFSFDLNELGPENVLIPKPAAERPDLRSYHYPGWDRTWAEDLAWLGAYDEPTVLDEYAPVFAPCLRGPGEGFGLAIDPGIRDYWGAGYQPFMAAALGERGVIGGLIWGGFGEVFAIPLDLTIGEGPWAHLPVTDYVRTRDHYPAEPGVFRRGDGDWGIFDAWNRPRPERWHVHRMYAPIELARAGFAPDGDRLEVELVNRFSHRSLAGLELRVAGGSIASPPVLDAAPGETVRLAIDREAGAERLRLEAWHEEGWLVDGHEWSWPGAGPSIQEAVLARAVPLELDLRRPGELGLAGAGRTWLRAWPELHVLDVDEPHIPVPSPRTDGGHVALDADGAARAPLASHDWTGWISVRVEDRTAVVEYDATYLGARPFRAKEIGLTLRPASDLRDLWWERIGEWTVYPADHVGRTRGLAPGAPGANGALRPAPSWDQDATGAGSNDYRSAKRAIRAGGATDGVRSLSVVSGGSQHLRAELVQGWPVLHVLDWYGGVRTLDGNHPIWSAYFGAGRPIETGTRVGGRIVLVAGERP